MPDCVIKCDTLKCRLCGTAIAACDIRRNCRGRPSKKQEIPDGGVGTEVKKILSRIGITASSTCQCNARAKKMDYMGIKWCEENVDAIVGWLRDEAKTRRLPYSDFAGKTLVWYAIRRAKKAGAREGQPE
jgi:hypothetical protein